MHCADAHSFKNDVSLELREQLDRQLWLGYYSKEGNPYRNYIYINISINDT